MHCRDNSPENLRDALLLIDDLNANCATKSREIDDALATAKAEIVQWEDNYNNACKRADTATARIEKLEAALRRAVEVLTGTAGLCEAWANQSRVGGWSTHQVDENRQAAQRLHEHAAAGRAALQEDKPHG